MKKIASALALSLVTFLAHAAAPSDESLRTLFSVMKAEAVLNGIYGAMEPAMRQGMAQATAGREPTPEQKRLMDRFSEKLGVLMRTELSWAKMEPIQMRIYRETFDQAEIDGLIEFYRSPVGQSFIDKMPLANQKAMAEMQAYMVQVMPKMQALMQEMAAEIKASK